MNTLASTHRTVRLHKEPIMSDHILSAILTFSLLAGGTAVIGSEMFNTHRSDKEAQHVVTLEPVTIVAHRKVALEVMTLAPVMITGHRLASTWVASETQDCEPRNVQ
jgi:hypothetical protein